MLYDYNSTTLLPQLHSYSNYQILLLLLLLLGLVYCCRRTRHHPHHHKKSQFKNRYTSISSDKIIIAIEIVGLLVYYSTRWRYRFRQTTLGDSDNIVLRVLRKVCGLGYYFKELFSQKQIREFLKYLRSLKKVQLFLYTGLDQRIGYHILQNLQLELYFPVECRKYSYQHSEQHKHVIDVDQDTRRVVILTAIEDDLSDENYKYFWLLRPNTHDEQFLPQTAKLVKEFVMANKDVDCLHEELAQLKIDYEDARMTNENEPTQ